MFLGSALRSQRQYEEFLTCDHLVRPHHLVVLVLQYVAVPHVTSGEAFERNDDASNDARLRAHRVFPAALRWRGRDRRRGKAYGPLILKLVRIEWPAIEDLEFDQVNVDRVRVVC